MSSLVIYGDQFAGQVNNGLNPKDFKYRFLVEGDSWMDRSAMFEMSLPHKLAAELDSANVDALIVNIAHFGDTIRRIGECAQDDFRQWLQTDFDWKFDALLLSAAGNDFIDAARDPDPGLGLLRNFNGQSKPRSVDACLITAALDVLKPSYINRNFDRLYGVVQNTPAAPGTGGSDGDWLNEIHPNTTGWQKLAKVWMTTLVNAGIVH